jgi:hypothetical protein
VVVGVCPGRTSISYLIIDQSQRPDIEAGGLDRDNRHVRHTERTVDFAAITGAVVDDQIIITSLHIAHRPHEALTEFLHALDCTPLGMPIAALCRPIAGAALPIGIDEQYVTPLTLRGAYAGKIRRQCGFTRPAFFPKHRNDHGLALIDKKIT